MPAAGRQVAGLLRRVEELGREVSELRCEAGYWRSRHTDALRRIDGLNQELEETKAANRKLKDRLFGKKSEKKSKDRSNHLDDPHDSAKRDKRKRGDKKAEKGTVDATIPTCPKRKSSSTCRRRIASALVAANRSPR